MLTRRCCPKVLGWLLLLIAVAAPATFADDDAVILNEIIVAEPTFRFADSPHFRNDLRNDLQLTMDKPMYIWRQPPIEGTRLYGLLTVGDKAHNQFAFALELDGVGNQTLYFDLNQNGDLTDDEGWYPNLSSRELRGYYATLISIPAKRVMTESTLDGEYNIWLYTDPILWRTYRMSFYSRTALEGEILANGVGYRLYLIDTGLNDGNLFNDGVCIDLDHNRSLAINEECFPPDGTVQIGYDRYRFRFSWE